MQMRSALSPARLAPILLVVVGGTVAGAATVGVAARSIGHTGGPTSVTLEATHLPPLLTLPGEPVQLAYDAYCVPAGVQDAPDDEASCAVTGSVFLRPGRAGPFAELPLTLSDGSGRHLSVKVPDALAASPSGFSYYAVLHAEPGDASTTLPAGGPAAPHLSLPLARATAVDLGRHVFGATRPPAARVARAEWGNGPDDVGLEPGRTATPIGASAFDVDDAGTVHVLDEAHHRVLRWPRGAIRPDRVPLAVSGSLADMAVAHDGSIYVLETVGADGRRPLVRRFDADGRELETVETAERDAAQIRRSPSGPLVLEHPSHQWMPVSVNGVPASPASQERGARTGRQTRSGEVVVLRRGNEIRIALVSRGAVRRSWRITSGTDVAEIQLAEPLGDRLVLVARLYTDAKNEFVVLILDEHGVDRRFSVDAADWAETAPLGRFKLAGSSLFRLGSTSTGAFVDRYDLEAPR